MKIIYLFFFFLLSFFFSCQGPAADSTFSEDVSAIPVLLDRSAAIQHGQEWDKVQNLYGTLRQLILNGKEVRKNRLQLAQLFTMEARVTGEHGHYYPAALDLLNQNLADPDLGPDLRFMVLTTKAGVQLSQHEFQAALETGLAALQINQYNAQIYGVLVDAYVELGDYEKAVEMSDKMIAIRPDLRSYSRVSYLREIHGMVDGSIEAMQLAVSAGLPGTEESAWTRLQLGELLHRYGQTEAATAQFQRILAERPDYPFAIAALADLEMEAGNYSRAEALLNQACAVIPEVGFYVQLADLYQRTDRVEKAKSTIGEVLVMLQDDVESGHQMDLEYAAVYSDLLNDPVTALTYARQDYDRRPENIDINRIMADLYLQMGDTDKAQIHLKRAVRTQSRHPELVSLQTELNGLSMR